MPDLIRLPGPVPGAIGLVRARGLAGWLIRYGDKLRGGHGKYGHAVVFVGRALPGKTIVEARPNGVRYGGTPPVAEWLFPTPYGPSLGPKDATRGYLAAEYAEQQIGVRYSWGEIASCVARLAFGWRTGKDASDAHPSALICSVLAVEAWEAAGVQLAPEGREYDFTPGDLDRLAG